MTIDSIVNNPFIIFGIFAITLLSFFLSIFFFLNSKREKILCYFYKNNTLIDNINERLSGLQLYYNDLPQKRVTISKFIIWNNGKQTIDYKDVVTNNPISIKCSRNIDLLDVQIKDLSEKSNSALIKNSIVKGDYQYIEIKFDFLDHKDFIKIQIVHDGEENELFELIGKVKGIKRIIKPSDPLGIYEDSGNPLIQRFIFSSVAFIVALIGLYNLILGKTEWYFWYLTFAGLLGAVNVFFSYKYLSPDVL